jgi:hypothetical protein
MTDLERIELALYRAQKSFNKDSDTGKFIDVFLREIQRQNQIVFELFKPKVVP